VMSGKEGVILATGAVLIALATATHARFKVTVTRRIVLWVETVSEEVVSAIEHALMTRIAFQHMSVVPLMEGVSMIAFFVATVPWMGTNTVTTEIRRMGMGADT